MRFGGWFGTTNSQSTRPFAVKNAERYFGVGLPMLESIARISAHIEQRQESGRGENEVL
jgi:hypothetical protein